MLPLQAASLSRYEAIAPGVGAYPVLRRTASVPGCRHVRALARPCSACLRRRSRSSTGGRTSRASRRAQIASRLGAGTVALQGAPIPPAARELTLHVRIRGVPVLLQLVAENATHGLVRLPLGERGPGSWTLKTALPPGGR